MEDPAVVRACSGPVWDESLLRETLRSCLPPHIISCYVDLPPLPPPRIGKVEDWLREEGYAVRNVLRLCLSSPFSLFVVLRREDNASSFCALQALLSDDATKVRFLHAKETLFLQTCDAIVFLGDDFVFLKRKAGEEEVAASAKRLISGRSRS